MLGNKVFERNNIPVEEKLSLPVNITNQPEGIYFMTVKGKESTLTMKVVIRK
jgi:hypothetical protein